MCKYHGDTKVPDELSIVSVSSILSIQKVPCLCTYEWVPSWHRSSPWVLRNLSIKRFRKLKYSYHTQPYSEFFKQSTILRGLLSMSANWSQEDTWLTCNFPSMTFSLMKLWLHIVLHNHLCIPCSKESKWQSHEKFLSIISQHLSRPQHVGMRIWYQK